ncbi:MAG TPA: SCP2 sterol-binding domain-containing protein [Nevskiaceae bacterium]|nr:SCP2 sterol-binding domain-containing protein [Nevskiaceae bacterium]
MATPAFACAALEVALNRYLRLEPSAIAECARLSGRTIELRVQSLHWSFFIQFIPTGVIVSADEPGKVDVTVSAPLTAFAKLGAASARGDDALPAGIQVEGDAELLTRFNKLIASIGFDLEEVLAKYLDDGAAHRLAQGLKDLLGWGRKTADTLMLDTAEYLREETGDLARASDVEEWSEGVDDLRERADRLEARLARLETRA